MSVVYLNGAYSSAESACISVFDRGFLFSDGVYEVTAVLEGRLVDFQAHQERLRRSCAALDLPCPLSQEAFLEIHKTLIARNDLQEGIIYLQITRGAAERDFLPPAFDSVKPTVFLFTQKKNLRGSPALTQGLRICTIPDLRWAWCHLKTIQLLYPSLMRAHTHHRGFEDAWFIKDGHITEGLSSNAYIVTQEGYLVTRPQGPEILSGVTRSALLALIQETGGAIEERPFSVEEALNAAEAFITGSGRLVCPVVQIDGSSIGTGEPGPITQRLQTLYLEAALRSAI